MDSRHQTRIRVWTTSTRTRATTFTPISCGPHLRCRSIAVYLSKSLLTTRMGPCSRRGHQSLTQRANWEAPNNAFGIAWPANAQPLTTSSGHTRERQFLFFAYRLYRGVKSGRPSDWFRTVRARRFAIVHKLHDTGFIRLFQKPFESRPEFGLVLPTVC